MFNSKNLCKGLASGLLLIAASNVYAIPVTYNFSITGTVLTLGTKVVLKDYTSPSKTDTTTTTTTTNLFGFTTLPSTITAAGTFTAEYSSAFTGSVLFNAAATGNTLTITGGSTPTILYASNDTGYGIATGSSAGPVLTFVNGELTGFDYQKLTTPKFNSLGMYFDDMTSVAKTQTGSGGSGVNAYIEYTTYNALLGQWKTGANNANLVATPVPEASTYAMMLAGLGMLGLMAVRRKSL